MAPQKRRHHQNNKKKFRFPRRNANMLEVLQHLLRNLSCWNCSQLGHNRFQCPFPKNHFCSFCRTPGVLTTKCSCFFARTNQCIPRIENREPNNRVLNVQDNNVEEGRKVLNKDDLVPMENIVIEFQNDELEDPTSEDYLEIDTERDFLDEM